MSRFAWMEIPDGYMMPQPHATTALGTRDGQSRSSNYLLKSGNELGIIDTGMQSLGLQELIEKIDGEGGNLRWIFLTHFHFDHIGNAAALALRYGCPVMAHPLDIPAIENPMVLADGSWGFPDAGTSLEEISKELGGARKEEMTEEIIKKYFYFPVRVDRSLDDGEEVGLGPWRLKVLHTPGHSPGSISLFNPASRSLYIGDLDYVMNPSSPWPISNASDLMASVQRVMGLDAEFLGPGHYDGIYKDWAVREYLKEILDRAHSTQQRMEVCLKRLGSATVDQLADEVFPVIPRYAYPPLHKSTIHCFLHKLMEEGRALKVERGGVVKWEEIHP